MDGILLCGKEGGAYHVRTLILAPSKQQFLPLAQEVCRQYMEVMGDRADILVQEITADWQIGEAILQYNPSVIVTTGNQWMQLLLAGLCTERVVNQKVFQDVERIHGNVLQVVVYNTVRYLFPLLAIGGTPDRDETVREDLNKLMLFITQESEALTPMGSPTRTGAMNSSFEAIYGIRRSVSSTSLFGNNSNAAPSSSSSPPRSTTPLAFQIRSRSTGS